MAWSFLYLKHRAKVHVDPVSLTPNGVVVAAAAAAAAAAGVFIPAPVLVTAYHQDPMRMTRTPDILGAFIDPMGGRTSYSVSRDPTSTGA